MDLKINGKVAVITAASAGLGKNIAHALAAEGVHVVLFARSADKLAALAQEITAKHGVRAVAIAGDMRLAADVKRLADTVNATFNGTDILVLNTGRAPNPLRATLDETEEERWQEAYQNQLWGTIQVAKEMVPQMLKKQWGRVIAITSASVKQPMPHHSLSTVFSRRRHRVHETSRQRGGLLRHHCQLCSASIDRHIAPHRHRRVHPGAGRSTPQAYAARPHGGTRRGLWRGRVSRIHTGGFHHWIEHQR
nr:SDR family NAD(P)-dependent oxidoreductase [Pseudomonas viciae]